MLMMSFATRITFDLHHDEKGAHAPHPKTTITNSHTGISSTQRGHYATSGVHLGGNQDVRKVEKNHKYTKKGDSLGASASQKQ